jgi:hypothetical protein
MMDSEGLKEIGKDTSKPQLARLEMGPEGLLIVTDA